MKRTVMINQRPIEVERLLINKDRIEFTHAGLSYFFKYRLLAGKVCLENEDGHWELPISKGSGAHEWQVALSKQMVVVDPAPGRHRKGGPDLEGQLTSPMPGKVLKYLVKVGDSVEMGQPVAILEAMKMEHTLKSPMNGVVEKIIFQDGSQVKDGQELLQIKENA